MFGTESRSQWRKKGKKSDFIWKGTDNKPRAALFVDQIQSDQTGLVPQFSGKLTSARI